MDDMTCALHVGDEGSKSLVSNGRDGLERDSGGDRDRGDSNGCEYLFGDVGGEACSTKNSADKTAGGELETRG